MASSSGIWYYESSTMCYVNAETGERISDRERVEAARSFASSYGTTTSSMNTYTTTNMRINTAGIENDERRLRANIAYMEAMGVPKSAQPDNPPRASMGIPKSAKPDLPNLEWLDRRVEEMRVRL